MNARSTLSHIEVTIIEGVTFTLSNSEGARLRITGPNVLRGTISEVRGLLWVIFPEQRGFGIAIKRPSPKAVEGFGSSKADDLWTAWDDERVEVVELLPGGNRRNYFDD